MTFEIIEVTRGKFFWLVAGIAWYFGMRAYWQYGDTAPMVFTYAAIGILAIGLLFILIIWLRGPFVADEIADYYLGKQGEEFDESTKWAIYKAAGGHCSGCGHRCIKGLPNSFMEFVQVYLFGYRVGHIDHIIPHSYGGNGDRKNGRLLCSNCNLERSNEIDEVAISLIDENGETIEVY